MENYNYEEDEIILTKDYGLYAKFPRTPQPLHLDYSPLESFSIKERWKEIKKLLKGL